MRATSRSMVAAVALMAALAGCVTQEVTPSGPRETAPGGVAAADAAAIADGVNAFLTLVGTGRHAEIRAMVLPAQARGFEAGAFIEDRFRVRREDFQSMSWDMARIGMTLVRGGPDVMTSIVVRTTVPAADEIRPIVVNLHWRRSGGRWWIVAYPEVA